MKKFCILGVAFGLLLAALPIRAHHSFSAVYDASKFIAVTGVLTRLEWENPHIFFYVDVTDDSGQVTTWAFEGSNTGPIRRAGTNRMDFVSNFGKVVTVYACPARITPNRAAAEQVKLPDGRLIVVGGQRYQGDREEALENLNKSD